MSSLIIKKADRSGIKDVIDVWVAMSRGPQETKHGIDDIRCADPRAIRYSQLKR
jgi:hypothetical protein